MPADVGLAARDKRARFLRRSRLPLNGKCRPTFSRSGCRVGRNGVTKGKISNKQKESIMKKQIGFAVCATMILLSDVTFAADKEGQSPATANKTAEVKAQAKCPVMGGNIDKKLFVDFDGKRIYVCCGGCIDKIKKDPAKYVKQLESEGITLDKAAVAAKPEVKKSEHGHCGM